MSDKDKMKSTTNKNMPKDAQVITAIMKEMGISECEPKTIVQLTEFVYRYGSTILEEAKLYINNTKQKTLEMNDILLALELQNENTFTTPPPREVLLECARNKNNSPLPLIKPPCGLRLPPDRHCLSSQNYVLKGVQKKQVKPAFSANKPTVNIIKRTNNFTINKQSVTIPKAGTKISNANIQQSTVLKPKFQVTQNVISAGSSNNGSVLSALDSMKRKREDGDD